MKAAWIGVIGTIIGALIGVFGAPYYKNIVDGPPEGIFSVDLSYISRFQIPSQLQDQIKDYPCTLKIIHLDGPAAEGVTVSISSDHAIKELKIIQNDENILTKLENGNKTLKIEIPMLRKNSTIDINFSSVGSPSFTKNVVMSKGRLAGETPKESKKPWYKSEYVVIPSILAGFGICFLALFYILRRYAEPYVMGVGIDRFKIFATLAATIAIFQFYSYISIVFVVYALVKLYQEILEIKQTIRLNMGEEGKSSFESAD